MGLDSGGKRGHQHPVAYLTRLPLGTPPTSPGSASLPIGTDDGKDPSYLTAERECEVAHEIAHGTPTQRTVRTPGEQGLHHPSGTPRDCRDTSSRVSSIPTEDPNEYFGTEVGLLDTIGAYV